MALRQPDRVLATLAKHLRVWTHSLGLLDQLLSNRAINARKGHFRIDLEQEQSIRRISAERYADLNGGISYGYPALRSNQIERAVKAGGKPGSKELLGIGSTAGAA